MHKTIILLFALFCFSALPASAQLARPIAVGEPFPELLLTTPQEAEHQEYLGIKGSTFSPNQIDAEVLLVELLNVHCPDCWTMVPEFNELFFMLMDDPEYRENIKLLGIAVGNSREEVDDFVGQHEVAYPVIADPKFTAATATGAKTTPFSFYLRQGAADQPKIIAETHHGQFVQHREIFEQLKGVARQSYGELRRVGARAAITRKSIASVATRENLEYQVRTLMLEAGGRIGDFSEVALRSGRLVFTAVKEGTDRRQRLFAEVVSSPPAGPAGHRAYFIYLFDAEGKVFGFSPLPATNKNQRKWTETEIEWLRGHVVGRYLGGAWSSRMEADTSTSTNFAATIVNQNLLAQGGDLMQELREKNLLGE